MNLPFSPSFFKRLEIYQELKDFEEEGKKTWKHEKKVLLQAAISKQLPIGHRIDEKDVQLLCFSLPVDESAHENALEISVNIIDSLIRREYGEKDQFLHNPTFGIKINARGYLAGRVLKETKELKKTGIYEFFITTWYVVIFFAFLLLTLQIANLWKDLTNKTGEKPTIINNIIMPTIPATLTITPLPTRPIIKKLPQ